MLSKFFLILNKQRGALFALAIISLFILFFQNEISVELKLSKLNFFIIRAYALLFILTAISILLLDYLKGNKNDSFNSDKDYTRYNNYLLEEINGKVNQIQEISLSKSRDSAPDGIVPLTEEDKEKLFNIITKTVSKNINTEFFKSLDQKYSAKIIGDARYKELLRDFELTRSRLLKEIDSLSRRANVNLVIGSVTTILAVGVLFTSVYGKEISLTDTAKALSYFIPRISTVIFIEIFSFFFLKLYRNNLNDVKYYQNEMTNIEFKILSVKSALMTEDKETLKQIISELNKTERNFILQKGETTVQIETARSQNKFDKSFVDNLNILTEAMSKFKEKI